MEDAVITYENMDAVITRIHALVFVHKFDSVEPALY